MKALKIVGVILGSIVLLAALLVGLAFVPAVQTWAVRKAVARQPGLKLEVGRVAFGPSTAEIRDLRLDQDGLVVTLSRISANYSAWDYYKHKRVNVDEVEVRGLIVDTRKMPLAATATTKPLPAAPASATPTPRAHVFMGVLNPTSSVAEVLLLPINGLRELGRVFRHYIGDGPRAFGQA
jgi:hypothetical protein